ncbi:Transcriptional activator of proteases prtT [Penicillium argentinense]|uniref:Transcriptional activator of proteases prtT n=1 Tax=Penicillium argentinense TaxID=1131581 RepID=A0A9W9EYB4_9EURO|nr:Transcriptional activator of proteases prtT [Penicillium argentinense]KAJ5090237.1 Transcriptional activator of proteases prtT [Penicillium argentinense]
MTRTNDTVSASWDAKSIVTDDAVGHERPRGRIRRSMTACNTCRKLKTRCDLDPRGHACRRCLSLRLECELPETPDRFQDNASTWSDANSSIPSIEERLLHLERGMGEMIHLMRQMVNHTSTIAGSGSPRSQVSRSVDESAGENGALPPFTLKPVQLIRNLQVECFNGRDNLTPDTDLLGDVVSLGIIDAKLSYKLIELFIEYYSPWMTIESTTIQRTDTLLFNTACLLASRYLPGMPASTTHDISLQVQHAVTKAMWRKSPLTNDVLQALALLCLYPTSGHKDGFIDGWLLSGISMNHALISFNFFSTLSNKSALTDEMLAQMRLWNTFCLTHLHSALGYGRTVNVQPTYFDHCTRILDHPHATSDDGRIVAEIQLYRITLRLQNTPHRLRSAETEYEEIERWKMDWAHLFSNEGKSTLELSIYFTHLILHRTTARLHSECDRLITTITTNARSIITRALQTRFAAAPGLIDNVYYILGYAALTLCDYTPSDPLIDQVRTFLLHLAPSSDHLAYRIACIVEVQRRAVNEQASPPASANAMFVPSQPRSENIDISQLIPGAIEGLVEVDDYAVYDQLMQPGYVPPQQAFSAPAVFQHPGPVVGGSMPMGLVPRALHDF